MISVHSISNSFLSTGQHRLKTGRLIIHYFVGQNLEYCHVQFEVYIYRYLHGVLECVLHRKLIATHSNFSWKYIVQPVP